MDENNQPQNNTAAAPAPEAAAPAPATPAAEQPAAAPTAPAEPKAPMDPKTKKTIIMLCIIGGVVVLLTVLAVIFLPIIFRVDYADAYKTAKELDGKFDTLLFNGDCDKVVNYYKATYNTNKEYNGYAEGCIASTEGLSELVEKLGNTSGVKRNSEIQELYKGFKESFDKLGLNTESLKEKLEIYKTWHAFEVARDDLDWKSTDSAYNTAGNILIQSGNEDLKNYGTKWLELALATAKAYRVYYDASWDSNYYEKKDKYYDAKDAFDNYVNANEPDITNIAPINLENLNATSTRFQNLFTKIADTYEENYNTGSNDCTEFLGDVYCDR